MINYIKVVLGSTHEFNYNATAITPSTFTLEQLKVGLNSINDLSADVGVPLVSTLFDGVVAPRCDDEDRKNEQSMTEVASLVYLLVDRGQPGKYRCRNGGV